MTDRPIAPNEVEEPIINSPFAEPGQHWRIEKGMPPVKADGRRPGSYYYRVPAGAARGRKRAAQLALIAETGHRPIGGAAPGELAAPSGGGVAHSGLSRHLPRDPGVAPVVAGGERPAGAAAVLCPDRGGGDGDLSGGGRGPFKLGMPRIPLDEPGTMAKAAGLRAFTRYACKMATGTGKTTVMGMLTAWSILNRIAMPSDDRFTDTVLVVCPNVTIRERLRELDPALGDLSLYRTRQLVPPHRMEDLRRGEVMVANWHRLAKQETNSVNGDAARVVRIGEATRVIRNAGKANETIETRYFESDRAWLKRIRAGAGHGARPRSSLADLQR